MALEETVERVTPGTESWDLYGYEHMQRYDFFTSACENKKVLDAACGTGYGSLHLLKKGKATSVLGIDVSEEALNFAKNYITEKLSFKRKDCLEINQLNETFDLIISFETIEHLSNPEEFIRQAHSILNPGGVFICSTPNKERLSGAGNINPFHPSELSYYEFKGVISKYFEIKEEFHQSETIQYFRYMETKHLISKVGGRIEAFFFNRIEKAFRKFIGKDFKYDPFMRSDLENLTEGDMEISNLIDGPKNWHKTYIITAIKG